MVPFQARDLVWGGRRRQDGRREDHTLTLLQRHVHLLMFLLSVGKGQKGGLWASRGAVSAAGLHGQMQLEPSGGQQGQHICFVRLRQAWDGAQCSAQGWKDPSKTPVELSVGTNFKSHPVPRYLYPGFPIAIYIGFPFGNREAD